MNTTHRPELLTPAQVLQAQRLAAAGLNPRAVAGVLEVDETTVLRSFRQPARQISPEDPAMWGLDCEPAVEAGRRRPPNGPAR